MEYIDNTLGADEKIAYRCRLHWAVFLGPMLVMVIGGLSIPSKGLAAFIILLIGVTWAIWSAVAVQMSEFGITEKRLLMKVGFPWKKLYEIPLVKVQDINVYQPTLGRILNFGKIMITVTGGRRHSFRMVSGPLQFAEKIHEHTSAARTRGEQNSPREST
jgi:membrane protein YdbS with pleckstrin-like domain